MKPIFNLPVRPPQPRGTSPTKSFRFGSLSLAGWLSSLLVLVSLMLAGGQGIVVRMRFDKNSTIGPLVLTSKVGTNGDWNNGWIRVAWDPKTPENLRLVDGKTDPSVFPNLMAILLDYVQPRYDDEESSRDHYGRIYMRGVETLLGDGRTFDFKVTNTDYAGPGQYGGMLIPTGSSTNVSIQLEMVRRGFAVVRHGRYNLTKEYGDAYIDSLLRAEGAARALKLGVWADR